MSIKVMAYADAGAHTGFERVMTGVMNHLNEDEGFEVIVQGLGYKGNPEFKYNYPVYPLGDYTDVFGSKTMPADIAKHKPDVLWFVQDLWNLSRYMSNKPIELPAICYFPVDTPNIKWSYALSMGAMEYPVAYTKFGAREAAAGMQDAIDLLVEGSDQLNISLEEHKKWLVMPQPDALNGKLSVALSKLKKWQNPENIPVIPHGLDKDVFKPLSKRKERELLNLNPADIIIGSINTNQFRKRQDLVFRIFAMVNSVLPNSILLMHCYEQTATGWDLPQLARYYGVFDKTYFVHESSPNLTDEQLNKLYNCCDVMINPGGGEGYGLTSAEGAACGVPQMVPDWSATRELWRNNGILMPVSDWRMEPKSLNTAHAIIDVKASSELLLDLVTSPSAMQDYSNKALAFAESQLTWDEVGQRFASLLRQAVGNPLEIKSESLQDLIDGRTETVRSELWNAVAMEKGTPLIL